MGIDIISVVIVKKMEFIMDDQAESAVVETEIADEVTEAVETEEVETEEATTVVPTDVDVEYEGV